MAKLEMPALSRHVFGWAGWGSVEDHANRKRRPRRGPEAHRATAWQAVTDWQSLCGGGPFSGVIVRTDRATNLSHPANWEMRQHQTKRACAAADKDMPA